MSKYTANYVQCTRMNGKDVEDAQFNVFLLINKMQQVRQFDMYPTQVELQEIMLKKSLLFFLERRHGMFRHVVCISYVYVFSPFFLLYLWTWQSKLSIIKLVSEL